MIILLKVGLIRKIEYKMGQYFPLLNYLTKVDLKWATGVATLNVAAKLDLASLKVKVDQIDIDKLKSVLAC